MRYVTYEECHYEKSSLITPISDPAVNIPAAFFVSSRLLIDHLLCASLDSVLVVRPLPHLTPSAPTLLTTFFAGFFEANFHFLFYPNSFSYSSFPCYGLTRWITFFWLYFLQVLPLYFSLLSHYRVVYLHPFRLLNPHHHYFSIVQPQ